MWTVDSVTPISVELDFSSSGQGRRRATAIDCDGTRLINALELVEFASPSTQVHICEQCGITHCESGGWIAMRRLGSSVLWIPDWAEMSAGAWESREYRPPPFLADRGAPCFTEDAWSQLASLAASVPPLADLKQFDSREAACVVQWSAPGCVLGVHPAKPKLKREELIAVDDGDLSAVADTTDEVLSLYWEQPAPVEPVTEADQPIEFYLDLPGAPAWAPVVRDGDTICLLVTGGPGVRRVAR